MENFENLEPLLRTFWLVAIPTSIIFALQSIFTFMGAGDTSGHDPDAAYLDTGFDIMQVFSLRNLINFLLGFSWTGIAFYETVNSKPLLIGFALAIGIVFVLVFFVIIRQVQKLAEDNSFQLSKALNKTAEVYLSIPAKREGKGKIIVSVNGAYHELDAITDNNRIPAGALVKIVRIDNANILIVETI